MRQVFSALTPLLAPLLAPILSLAALQSATAVAAEPPAHPREVAFVDEGAKGSVYRRFPSGERLYTYDGDGPNRSNCNKGCASAWPPVIAPANANPIGDWSIVQRDDGRRQWALQGKPVYLRFHDTPDTASGDGIDGVWRVVPYVGPTGEAAQGR